MKIISQRKISCHMKNILRVNNCKKILIKIGIYLIFLSIAILIALLPNIVNQKSNMESKPRFKTDLKYILFWKQMRRNKKNFFNRDVEYATGQTEFIKQNCPFINCYITYNKSFLHSEEDFNAIVFNILDLKNDNVFYLNSVRSQSQIYIFKSHMPAEDYNICDPSYDDFFNWTWTYKLNSDIPHPFINVFDNQNNLIGPKSAINWIQEMKHTNKYKAKLKHKAKAVASLVTSCKLKNKHQEFIKSFREELNVYNYTLDTFGPCSEKKCPKGAKCLKIIDKEYFFNLVLEDAFSEDYVTEKMVKAMTSISLPIVTGNTNYTYFLPPGSYINAHEFSIKKLGAIVIYLTRNPKKYSYFFDWKDYYNYTAKPRTDICDLCTKLNKDKLKKTYKDFRRWWNPEFYDTCQGIRLYNMFRDSP